MPGVSLSSKDCLAQITDVLPHQLLKMEEFPERLEMFSRKFQRRKIKNVAAYYGKEKGEQLSSSVTKADQRLALIILKVRSHLYLMGVWKERGVENTSLPW